MNTNSILESIRKKFNLTFCPPDIIVPLENIDFKLKDSDKNTYGTEYVFTTSFNEHCYVVFDKQTGKQKQPLYLSHGRKTFIHDYGTA